MAASGPLNHYEVADFKLSEKHTDMHPKDKARTFRDLSQLVKSGVPFPKAVQTLGKSAKGSEQRVLSEISRCLDSGGSISEALNSQRGELEALEIGLIAVGDTCGRLDVGLDQCATYYAALHSARERVRSKFLYPLFLVHFAMLSLALPQAFGETGSIPGAAGTFFSNVLIFWMLIGAVYGAYKLARSVIFGNEGGEAWLWKLPALGPCVRDFAISRFCSAYSSQLAGGIGFYMNLEMSGRAGASRVLDSAATKIAKFVSDGGSLADGVRATGVFPEEVVRVFDLAESGGLLDAELGRVAIEFRESAFRRLEALSEWLPKLLMIGSYVYVGWTVVRMYMHHYDPIFEMLKDR